jgi:hypothetical protein
MNKTARQLLLWPVAVLAVIAAPVLVLIGAARDRITCTKASVASDTLYLKKAAIDAARIEMLTVRAYSVGASFKLKIRDTRPIRLLPSSGKDLVAWARRHGVNVILEGESWAIGRYR